VARGVLATSVRVKFRQMVAQRLCASADTLVHVYACSSAGCEAALYTTCMRVQPITCMKCLCQCSCLLVCSPAACCTASAPCLHAVAVCRSHITSVEWSPYESSMLATTGGDNQVRTAAASQPQWCCTSRLLVQAGCCAVHTECCCLHHHDPAKTGRWAELGHV
jgi:hypothetical protein